MTVQTAPRERLWQTTSWGVWMLALSVFLNYVDRGALSIAMPQIKGELSLDPNQLGTLAAAFFWTYAILQVPAGWLVDKYDVKWVLAGGFALWTIATGLTGYSSSFSVLLGMRLLLGIGESVAYPAYSRVIAERFPPERQGLPNALIDFFSKMGPALSTLIGGLLVAQYGWRTLFFALGMGGLVWLLPWMIWQSKQRNELGEAPPQVSFGEVLSRRECWGSFFGLFAFNYTWYFLIFWFPSYLVMERGFSQEKMATFGSVPFFCIGGSAMLFGWLSDRWIMGGRSATVVRKTCMTGGLLATAGLLLLAGAPNPYIGLATVSVAGFFMGMFSSNNWAVTQTLAGRAAAGRWTGLQNGFGNFGGVVSPQLTGFVVAATGSFYLAFVAAAVVLTTGAVLFYLLVPRVEPIQWSFRPKVARPAVARSQG